MKFSDIIPKSAPGLPEFLDSMGKPQDDAYAPQDASLNIFGATELTDLERRFLNAAECGNLKLIRRIIEEDSSFNVNCVDILGRTALQLAVTQEHFDVVKFLLVRCGKSEVIEDAFLHAIKHGYVKMCEMFINHPMYKNAQQKMETEQQSFYDHEENNSDFSPDITPILLASHCNNFDIVFMLIQRGFYVQRPHPYFCGCTECINHKKFDRVVHSRSRLNAYQGLASPAYMSLSSDDPILTAFELSQLLFNLSEKENEYKSEYRNLSDKCKDYAVNLLDLCRTEAEVNAAIHGDGEDKDLSRIRTAIQYEQRRFIAHASCQERLMSLWYADAQWIRNKSTIYLIFMIPLMSLLMPILAVIYIVAPHSKPARFLRIPVIKFVHHSISYVVFLVLLFVVTNEDKDLNRMVYDSDNLWVYVAISFFVFGMFWNECKQLADEGAYTYINDVWNGIDILMLALYTAAISLWIVETLSKRQYIELVKEHPNATLHYPDMIPPHIMANILFSVANVLSFSRVAYMLPASETFGQLQISYGRMLKDVFKFLFIYATALVAFMNGLTSLYSVYQPVSNPNIDNTYLASYVNDTGTDINTMRDSIYFSSFIKSFVSLFMSTFGLGDPKAPDLTPSGTDRDGDLTDTLIVVVGYILYGVYIMFATVVLINMLIAMMSNTFEEIRSDEDVEWKFARAKLWMSYFEDGCTLPIPFNVIPTPKSLKYFLLWVMRRSKSNCGPGSEMKEDYGSNEDAKPPNAYKMIMRKVVMRYVHSIKHGKKKGSKDDFVEVKEEISTEIDGFHLKLDKKLNGVNASLQFMAEKLVNLEKRLTLALNIPPMEETHERPDTASKIEEEIYLMESIKKVVPATAEWNRGKFVKNPNKKYIDIKTHVSNSVSGGGSKASSSFGIQDTLTDKVKDDFEDEGLDEWASGPVTNRSAQRDLKDTGFNQTLTSQTIPNGMTSSITSPATHLQTNSNRQFTPNSNISSLFAGNVRSTPGDGQMNYRTGSDESNSIFPSDIVIIDAGLKKK